MARLDADQYWQAFVEKHHFYHNHLASAVEDPESKDYDAKNKATLKRNWETFDGRGTTRQNNKLLLGGGLVAMNLAYFPRNIGLLSSSLN